MDAIRDVYFNRAVRTQDLLARVREIDPDITQQQLDDWIDNMQNTVIRGVYEVPGIRNPTTAHLFRIVKAVDPRITAERFRAYIINRRNDREDLLRRIYYEEDLADLDAQLPPAPGFASVDKTLQYARRVDPRIPRDVVADFIRKQSIDQDVQRARRLGTFLPTGALDQIELDLADFSTKAGGESMYGLGDGAVSYTHLTLPTKA